MHACAWVVSIAAAAALLASPGLAGTVVIPNVNESQPGPSNQAFPFNQGNMRYQQVYAADQFRGLTGNVTHISYRVDESTGSSFTSGPMDVEIRLSHTTRVPNALSDRFDDNLGADVTLVHDGPLTLSSAGTGLFDIVIDIDDRFVYDGVRNLIVEIKVFGPASTTQFDAAGTGLGQGGTPWTDRLWAFDPNAAVGSSLGDDGYVTQFTLDRLTPVRHVSWGSVKAAYRGAP